MDEEDRAIEDKGRVQEVLCNKEDRAIEDRAIEDRCNTEGRCNKEAMEIKAVKVKNIETTSRAKIRFNF